MNLTRIEVEYRVYQQKQAFSDLPAEFRGMVLNDKPVRRGRPSRVLMFLADRLIQAGVAIHNSQRSATEQRLYS